MQRNLLILIFLLATYPVCAQNNYPVTTMQDQPYSSQLRSGEPQPFGRPSAPANPAYPSTSAVASTGTQAPAQGVTQAPYQVVSTISPNGSPTITEPFRESWWYTRIDYFHWNERADGADFVNEYGTLATLGYEHRVGQERYRGELFGATVKYVGSSQSGDPNIPDVGLHSNTKYLGFRLEYDLLFEPESLPQVSFFAGLGSRFWVRDMPDDLDDNGNPVQGYQETWWTIYPYIGIEKRRTHEEGIEFYYSARFGCTPITYQRVEDFEITLYPQIGMTGKLEAGIRSRRFLLSAYFEGMSWNKSDVVRGSLQPASTLTTVGIQAGLSF
jgi:hypothetical protein